MAAMKTFILFLVLAVTLSSMVAGARLDPWSKKYIRSLKLIDDKKQPHSFDTDYKDPFGGENEEYLEEPDESYGTESETYEDDHVSYKEPEEDEKKSVDTNEKADDNYGEPYKPYATSYDPYKQYTDSYEPISYNHDPWLLRAPHRATASRGAYPISPEWGYYWPAYRGGIHDYYHPAPKKNFYDMMVKADYDDHPYDRYAPPYVSNNRHVIHDCDHKDGYGCKRPFAAGYPTKPRASGYPSITRATEYPSMKAPAYYPTTPGYSSFGRHAPIFAAKQKYPSHGLDSKADFSSHGKHGLYGEGDIAQKFFGDSKTNAYGTNQHAGGYGGAKVKGLYHGDLATELDASTYSPYGRRNDVWTKALNKVKTDGYAKSNYFNDLFSKTNKFGAETKAKAANQLSGHGNLSAVGGISAGTKSTGPKLYDGGY